MTITNKDMKDNKFRVLCVLGIVWALLFGAMLFGVKVNPRIEMLVSLICVGWFAYWTLSFIRSKPQSKPTEQQDTNAKSTKTPKSE